MFYFDILIDSMNFIPGALKYFPKTFVIKVKGYFPHNFNTRENENYVGCLYNDAIRIEFKRTIKMFLDF